MGEEKKICGVCGAAFTPGTPCTPLEEAGEWLSAEFWADAGRLCPPCLENRARLALMYIIDR
ncbi:hypothetical protein [Geobacter sp.]|uniref:hypothetical protein n=1 Tax=Geobacter sp. TaxID=46610 RepID=UPI0026264DAC|nr:hypothetical protein [Geobacter sp.]